MDVCVQKHRKGSKKGGLVCEDRGQTEVKVELRSNLLSSNGHVKSFRPPVRHILPAVKSRSNRRRSPTFIPSPHNTEDSVQEENRDVKIEPAQCCFFFFPSSKRKKYINIFHFLASVVNQHQLFSSLMFIEQDCCSLFVRLWQQNIF